MVFFMLFSLVEAITVDKNEIAPVIIAELDSPAVFELSINNSGVSEEAEIYTLIGVSVTPKFPFQLEQGTNSLEAKFYPSKEMKKQRGFVRFEYQIKGEKSGIFKDSIRIKIVSLKDSLDFSSGRLNPDSPNIIFNIANLEQAHIEDAEINFKSSFFDETKKISLKPLEKVNVSIPVYIDKVRTFKAGQYIYKINVNYKGVEAKFEKTFDYLEKEGVSVSEENSGFIVRRNVITKKNEGNVPVKVKIENEKDIISRLFVVNSLEPLNVKRDGFFVKYSWEKEIQPAESFSITTTINYTMPFILIIIVAIIVYFVWFSSRNYIVLNKRVSFVRTKGGEFALKIRLHVKAKKFVENVQIIDRLPGIAVLYEKFGIKPDVIDSSNRRLIWKTHRLNAGEERVFSYIVYSKIKIVGRYELPSAMAIFERNGKNCEASSNRTFFVAGTTSAEE